MVNHCINPLCDQEMGRLGVGELYSYEFHDETGTPRKTEFFWICPACASFLKIRLDKEGHPMAAPKSEAADARWPLSGHDLRLAFFTDSESIHALHRINAQAIQRSADLPLAPVKGEAA
jgi:hypothetical protein